jgi:hypothetical protein
MMRSVQRVRSRRPLSGKNAIDHGCWNFADDDAKVAMAALWD